ncbi:MAG TPA: SGNH/GDSL hydrolase family protein [Candidatus Baltobacteraceae bacterium]|nr:SGNH/GDSL hydrolase family protein [Candidatus Baltobacteraceae bacterium]
MHFAPVLLAAWIGTWASSPVQAGEDVSFQGDTLREIVHVSIGGSSVRVRFTNRFGNSPLVISDATIAVESGGTASALAGSLHDLTFMGASSVTIPPNADVYSDAATLQVPPKSNLLVSMYLPDAAPLATEHQLTNQTNYYAQGEHSSDVSGAAFSHTYTPWYFIDGVDVSASGARGAIVAFGDSITDGAGGEKNANDRWPDFLASRLQTLPPSRQLGVLNAGISGNRILLSSKPFGIDALARMDSDVLSQSSAADVIVLLGINDIQQTPHQYDASQIELGLQQIVEQAHARGLRAIGCTITPYEGWLFYDTRGEATRQAVNEWIRRSGTFDAVVDFDAAVRDPSDPHRLLPAYDSGDHLHPNAAGHRVMANTVNLSAL